MIEKEPGNAKVHCMRMIHLYRVDYNFILGVKWRQMLYDSNRAESLHCGQFSGEPGRNALTPGLFSWKSSKMRSHMPVENLASTLATVLLHVTTISFWHWQVLLGVNRGYIKMESL
jgi:hypothetical protein